MHHDDAEHKHIDGDGYAKHLMPESNLAACLRSCGLLMKHSSLGSLYKVCNACMHRDNADHG